MLVVPSSLRWRPLRSGLINLFKYENEVFQFEDGRLLLRGNNGAGKSRVLALQLPFLLDGEIASHRVEPDGDPAKRMEWNLLMGGRHENRLGYTWIEFGRVDEDGVAHYLTLACGLHARRHGNLNRWFIVTPLRIGDGLELLSDQKVPLTRDRLEAALDGHGRLIRGVREYRAAVDEALFKLGSRFEPLIELLLRLRQPQLARKLDETVLSKALSEALPPISSPLLEDVAASFRGIEDDRDAMDQYRQARDNVDEFLKGYQVYARVVVRRHADNVRTEQSQFEQRSREIKRFGEEREAFLTTQREVEAHLVEAEQKLTAGRATERALRDSPEMKQAETLELAKDKVEERRRARELARQHHEHAEGDFERAAREHGLAAERTAERRKESEESLERFSAAAEKAALPLEIPATRQGFDEKYQQREEGIRHLRIRNAELSQAQALRDESRRDLERCRKDLEVSEEKAQQCDRARESAVGRFVEDVSRWESGTTELKMTDSFDWYEATSAWLEDRRSPFPFDLSLRELYGNLQRDRIAERELIVSQQRELKSEFDEVVAEIAALESGRQSEPPMPYTRDESGRVDRPGVPFWKAFGFKENVSQGARSGYEAALESAGVLDAWVMPNGQLIDEKTGDVFLNLAETIPLGEGLSGVLQVELGDEMAPVLEQILGCIGAESGSGTTWVTEDGAWRNGLLSGHWSKSAAEYLGFTAREEARKRRIEALKLKQSNFEQQLQELDRQIEQLAERLKTLDAERDAAPGPSGILDACAALDASLSAVRDTHLQVGEADRLASKKQEEWASLLSLRDSDAVDLGLSDHREMEALEALREAMIQLQNCAIEFWGFERAHAEAETALTQSETRKEEAEQRLATLKSGLEEAARRFTESEAAYKTLLDTHGKTAQEVLARLEMIQGEISQWDQETRTLRSNAAKLGGDIRVKDEQIRASEEQRQERQRHRDQAVTCLHSLVEHEFIGVAESSLQPTEDSWTVARAVELARRAEQTLQDTLADDKALAGAQTRFQEQLSELNDQLGMRGYHPQAKATVHGVWLVKCPFQGQDRTMTALLHLLSEEVNQRSQMLDERERAVIENHLIGEVAKELQERIREGEDWVRDVNAEMEKRPTSSGIKLKFVWRVDPEGPPGLAEANQQLLRLAATWSPAERQALGDFLQERIRSERTENESGSWQEHLTRALDYRAWRRFEVERWQDGNWQRLTKRTYGTGSGGEKAMTLTVPQFAAAAAHYRSASEIAPRLILLDEVFVGIDGETRAKLMGLLETFDLDFVMTSEREWGCYASVPSLAIYQLASRADVQAVHVTRWVWNGKERKRDG